MRIYPLFVCACALVLAGCMGSSAPETARDPASGQAVESTAQAATLREKLEIPIGAPVSRVLRDLGPADSTDMTDDGREIWRYIYKRAEYIYVSNAGNVQTLVVGGYIADPQPESPGQTLLLTVVLDPAKKVADFNFALMAY